MSNNPDPNNPNARHFGTPTYIPRPCMKPHTVSRKIQTSQSRIMRVNPAKITLAPTPWEKEAAQ